MPDGGGKHNGGKSRHRWPQTRGPTAAPVPTRFSNPIARITAGRSSHPHSAALGERNAACLWLTIEVTLQSATFEGDQLRNGESAVSGAENVPAKASPNQTSKGVASAIAV